MNRLIYDVGVNDGADTAHYLSKGFRVIGIEASPVAIASLEKRFASEIADNRLTLLNLGIAKDEGEFEFWVCEDHPEWSSFDRSFASRKGSRHHAVRVATKRFADVVREHGVAHYCKIDIEGNDRACIAHLPNHLAPEYISIEMSHRDGNVDLQILQDLGYTRFKIISQRTLVPPNRLAAQVASWFPVGRQVFYRVERLVRGIRSQDGWRFPLGSSGPFGERTGGRWLSFDDALRTWSFLSALDAKAGTNGLADWFDIHATR